MTILAGILGAVLFVTLPIAIALELAKRERP